MKCSLLTLSTFIDDELAPQRRAEVDAHLIGCSRCSAGAATLREEKARVGQLARVSIDPGSAQLMLEQVGIAIDPATETPRAAPAPPAPPEDDRRPWQRGTSSPALPWTPRRPDRVPPTDEVIVPAPAMDVQPDLPLEGVRSVPASWNRSARPESTERADPDPERDEGVGVPESWEADLPAPVDPTPPTVTSWSASTPLPPAEVIAAPPLEPAAPPPTAPAPPLHAPPPTRVAAASGPAALWSRVHDAITVRLALARGGDALDESVQIISGAPTRPSVQLPKPDPSESGIVAASPAPPSPPSAPPPDLEPDGLGEARAPAEPASTVPSLPPVFEETSEPAERPRPTPTEAGGQPTGDEHAQAAGWNAFAASSYPDTEMPHERATTDRRPRPLGRHSRAVARDQVPVSARIGRVTAAVRTAAGGAMARARQGVGRLGAAGPDNRLLAGVAAIGLIFVVALLIGHGTSRPSSPVAARPAATAQPQPHQSAPAQSSAPAATSAPVATPVQTFGAGDTGFQVVRLRYGSQAAYMRVVFDLGPARGAAPGTPRVTISFPTPTTMLVTLDGTLPAGSTGSPTAGKVISSVTLVSSSHNTTVYRFGLTRAATATAFYLASPTRFVLDVH